MFAQPNIWFVKTQLLALPERPLRSWQGEALESWRRNSQRGIVAAATGTGKTLLACHAMSAFWGEKCRAVVVVPKQSLQEQWVRMFRSSMNLGPQVLGTIGGREKSFALSHRVVVAVIDSARSRLAPVVQHWKEQNERVMLIVDECHWAGSERSVGMLAANFDATLGLSATPERGDDGFDDLLVPRLGRVVYRYPLRDALDDELLAPLEVVNAYFDLDAAEQREHAKLTDQIRALRAKMPEGFDDGPGWDARLARAAASDSDAHSLRSLLQRRRRLTVAAAGRLECVTQIVREGLLSHRRTLVFNESIEQAESVAAILRHSEVSFEVEHSRLSAERRQAALRRFAGGACGVLVAVRALDEGIDVPEADQAIIVSGTFNRRQRIQRIGRVVRPSGSKARVISLLAAGTPEQWEVGAADPELLGPERVREVWLSKVQTFETP